MNNKHSGSYNVGDVLFCIKYKAINQERNDAALSFLPLYLMRVSGSSAVNKSHDSYIPNIAWLTVNLKARTIFVFQVIHLFRRSQ